MNRRIDWLIVLGLALLFLALLALTIFLPIARARGQERLTIEQLHIRTSQGDVLLVQAPGQPVYTCVGCTSIIENSAPAPGYRATLNITHGAAWELVARHDGQVVRVGSVYTQRFSLVGK